MNYNNNVSPFVQEIYDITLQSLQSKQNIINDDFILKQDKRRNNLYLYLTNKYYNDIKKKIKDNAKEGKFQIYYNFNKDDFKANFPGLGTPFQVCKNWLICLSHENCVYLNNNETLMGIEINVVNNGALTTKFSWKNIIKKIEEDKTSIKQNTEISKYPEFQFNVEY